MNLALAKAMLCAVRRAKRLDLKARLIHKKRDFEASTAMVRLRQPHATKPIMTSPKDEQDKRAIGGMRNPLESLKKLPKTDIGSRIRVTMDRFFDTCPDFENKILQAIGGPKDSFDYSDPDLAALRGVVSATLSTTDTG